MVTVMVVGNKWQLTGTKYLSLKGKKIKNSMEYLSLRVVQYFEAQTLGQVFMVVLYKMANT